MSYRRRAAIVALTLAAACSEATATNEAPARSTETADPDFHRDATRLLAGLDGPNDSTDLGVIVAENEDGMGSDWVVLTHGGDTVLLETAYGCDDDGDTTYESDLWQLIDPGDLIIWSTDGDDTAICTGEVEIARKAAVTP